MVLVSGRIRVLKSFHNRVVLVKCLREDLAHVAKVSLGDVVNLELLEGEEFLVLLIVEVLKL